VLLELWGELLHRGKLLRDATGSEKQLVVRDDLAVAEHEGLRLGVELGCLVAEQDERLGRVVGLWHFALLEDVIKVVCGVQKAGKS